MPQPLNSAGHRVGQPGIETGAGARRFAWDHPGCIVLAAVNPYWVALIGLGGAVVGGAITSGSNLLIESTRRRHQHEDEDKRAEHEQRRAVRIVLAELEEVDYSIRRSVGSGVVGPAEMQFPAIAWAEHHTTLADLDEAVWSSVHSAYAELNALNWSLRWRIQLRQVRTPQLTEIEKARFRQVWLAVRGAQQALGPLDVGEQKAAGRVAAHQQVTAKVDRDLWP